MRKISELFFFLFLIAFPFGQLARIPFSFLPPEARIYLTDIFLFLSLFFWMGWHLVKKKKMSQPWLCRPILTFFGVGLLSLLANVSRLTPKEVVISSLYLLRWLVYTGVYFFVFNLANRSKNKFFTPDNLLKTLAVLGTMVAFFGLIQYFLWPDLRTFEVAYWDPHYFRVVSTMLDPGFTGLILVFTLVLIVGLFFYKSRQEKNQRMILVFLAVVVYSALALTYSRSSYLAYLVTAGIMARFRQSTKFFLAALLILILTMIWLPRPGGEGVRLERWASIEARIRNWGHSLTVFKDHFLLGVGFNSYRYAQRDYGFLDRDWRQNHAGAGADSSLLLVLATTGLVGFIVYLWLWVEIFKLIFLKIKKRPGFSLAWVALATLISLWAHSFFLNSLFYPWVMIWVWVLIAALEGFKKEKR